MFAKDRISAQHRLCDYSGLLSEVRPGAPGLKPVGRETVTTLLHYLAYFWQNCQAEPCIARFNLPRDCRTVNNPTDIHLYKQKIGQSCQVLLKLCHLIVCHGLSNKARVGCSGNYAKTFIHSLLASGGVLPEHRASLLVSDLAHDLAQSLQDNKLPH